MARFLLVAIMALLMQACISTAKEMNTDPSTTAAIQALLWVESADANGDALRAIEAGDYRLFVAAGRGQNVPGLSVEENTRYRSICGEKLIPGTTDVVRGDRHLQLLQAAYRYAEEYNRIVINRCAGR